MQNAGFLSEFPPVSTAEWEQAIREIVAGTDYPAKLIWHAEEGLAVKPYYRAEDLAGLEFLKAGPGEFPFVRGARATSDWRIRERVEVVNPREANRAACEAVIAGASEIAFAGAKIADPTDISLLLANLDEIPIHFDGLSCDALRILVSQLSKEARPAGISASVDPLSDLDFSAELLGAASPGWRPFTISCEGFQEQAAGVIGEVGLAVSAAVEFLDQMSERGISIDRAVQSVGFSFSMGPELFLQIAKLRAFRMVWARIVESFCGNGENARAPIHARTAEWNKTIYDPHVNVLRATTEAISAILGGADSISVAAFDECYKLPDESSRRLARNTQLLLKREAHLSRVADPVGGSYLIESLTDSIAVKAWKLFQELESAGGYAKAKDAGIIGSVLENRERCRQDSVDHRRVILTGTNRFANSEENALERIDSVRSCTTARVAHSFESLRLRTEKAAQKKLKIVLAEIGDPKMRRARSQFASEFLACAGFAAEARQFRSAVEMAACEADVLVLCSSDQEYLPIVSELMPGLRTAGNCAHILVAGNPGTKDELSALGVSDFMHLGSNAVEVLDRLQQIGFGD